MVLVSLLDEQATDEALVGPKAARLARAAQAGLPVPPALILTVEAWQQGLAAVRQALVAALEAEVGQGRLGFPLAVRSSALAEDLAEASFAGMQASVLGVMDQAALFQAIETVWASAQGEAARAYRAYRGITGEGQLAVILQQQIASIAAGVAFARDPLTGADVTVVEAVAGLGEALVSGQGEPLTWRVQGGVVVARPGEALVPDAVVLALAALVAEVGHYFEAPQDVEWGWDGVQLWLLQSRPITTRLEDFFNDRAPGDQWLWTAAFLNERFTQPVSPLGWTLVAGPLAALAFGEPLRLLGVSLARLEGGAAGAGGLLKLYRGHPYSRVGAWQRMYKIFPDWALPEDAVRYFPEGDVSLRRAPAEPRWGWRLVWQGLHVLWREGQAALPWSNGSAWREYERDHAAWLARLGVEAGALGTLPEGAQVAGGRVLLGQAQAQVARLLTIHRWSLLWADLTFSLLRRVCQAVTDRAQGAALAVGLTAGGGGGGANQTALLNQAVAGLGARAALRSEVCVALEQAGTCAEVAALLGEDDPFVRALRGFLRRYGHRFLSLDFYDPPFEVDARPLFGLILTLAAQGEGGSEGPENGGDMAEVRRAEMARLGLMARAVVWLVGPLVALVREQLRLREDQRFRWQEWLAFQRRVVVLLGQVWARQGVLPAGEAVFGLTWGEVVDGVVDGQRGAVAAGRLARLQQLRQQAAQAPGWHYPDFLRGHTPLRAGAAGGRLQGRPVSPGLARGPARLVTTQADLGRVRAGDVLVTTSPDPGWTPAFVSVAAVVTERGGQLSHGAVVAREYGVPAVFGVAEALTILVDGEAILVDGTQGLVIRLGQATNVGD